MKHSRLVHSASALLSTAFALSFATAVTAAAAAVPSRIVASIDASDTVTLAGNTHPLAKPAADQGRVPGPQQLGRMFIVLQRSDDQARELAAFNARQYDPASPDYHHWLQPEEFGLSFGPNDADLAAVTNWLKSSGLQILHVSPGRISIEFSGTAVQVESALHVQMHNYLMNGVSQISNDRDPQIPRALNPVVVGVSGLNDFPLNSDVIVRGPNATLDAASGRFVPYTQPSPDLSPSFGGMDPQDTVSVGANGFNFVTPYDFATIYNSLPLWNAGIVGTGVTIAIVGENNVNLNDIAYFRANLGLPANVPSIDYVGTNPGGSSAGDTVALEMAGAAAPGARLVLVVPDGGTNSSGAITISGFLSAIHYIIAHDNVNIVSAGYSSCELFLGTSNNTMVNSAWQQAETQGMSIFASTGSQGSAGCASGERLDTYGLQVSGIASSQFVTAVGATDFASEWLPPGGPTYWSSTPGAHEESAKGYVPEMPWNVSCANSLVEREFIVDGKLKYPNPVDVCNAIENSPTYFSLVTVEGGGGGKSSCTSLTASGECVAGSGYTKPPWQAGTGVPAENKRHIPDVALFASGGWPPVPGTQELVPTPLIPSNYVLACYSGKGHACTYDSKNNTYADLVFQSAGGSVVSAAYWAGIMALVEQKHGGTRQGLANLTLYKLFGKENLSACNTLTVKAGNACVFYDVAASLSNAQPCEGGSTTDCDNASGVSSVKGVIGILTGYDATIGYDQATGLGSVNITNLVDNWSAAAPSPTVSLSATSLAFGSVTVGSAGATKTLTIKNTGSVAVTFKSGGITLTGADAAVFSKTKTCGSYLFLGGSCTITVTFKPKAVGSASGTLSIADNAAGSPQTVSLSGTGTSGS
jgi:Pro-kumamolisin, activation domain/Abnormal spindle-like microcephaly-assoc'd, ASPM-SPD-2-Hydin